RTHGGQFLAPPARRPPPPRQQRRHERRIGRLRAVMRPRRPTVQPRRPARLVARKPLVARSPTDLIVGAQLSHRPAVPLTIGYETHAKIHGRHSLPWHGEKCYPCPRTVLLP